MRPKATVMICLIYAKKNSFEKKIEFDHDLVFIFLFPKNKLSAMAKKTKSTSYAYIKI